MQVANDGPGVQILAELQGDGVDISNVVVRMSLLNSLYRFSSKKRISEFTRDYSEVTILA